MDDASQKLVEKAKEIRDLARRRAPRAEQQGRLDKDVVSAVGESGILASLAPAEFGGKEQQIDQVVRFCSIVGEGCMSTSWVIGLLSVHNWMAGLFSVEAQREIFDPRNSRVISATFSPKGKAMPVEGGYRLTGRWPFLSGSHHAAWIIVGGMCMPRDKNSRPTPKVFIVPQKAYQILDTWHVSGMKATGSCDVTLEDQFVPEGFVYDLDDLLNGTTSAAKSGLSRNAHWPMAPVVAFSGVGTAFGGARRAIQLYGERLAQFNDPNAPATPGGSPGARQSAIVRYSDLHSRLYMVEALIERSMNDWKEKSANDAVTLQDRADARVHCTRAVRECRDIVFEVLDCMGSRAQYEDQEVQRIGRDVGMVFSHVLLDHDGSNDVAGRLLLGMHHNTLLI